VSLDADIDALYRLPPAKFTAARNELAKRAGSRAGEIKALARPNLPAWAVNQLYWQRRPAYDALVRAAGQLRAGHARRLTGHPTSTSSFESAHADALKRALDETRALIVAAGETASPATLNAVAETLQALPSDAPPGRLSRPLKPLGFEALARLLPAAGRAPLKLAVPARPTPHAPSRETPRQAAAAKKQAEREAKAAREAERREAAERAKALRAAQADERQAAAALARARMQLSDRQQQRDRLTRDLERVSEDLDRLRRELREREAAHRTAAAHVAALS
jgi:hypothetical protein